MARVDIKTPATRIAERAIKAALKDTMKQVRTMATREVAKRAEIKKVSALKKRSYIRVERAGGIYRLLSAMIPVSLLPTKIRRSKGKQYVSVKIKGGMTALPGAFKAKVPSGHTGIFKRGNKSAQATWRKSQSDGKKRWLPISNVTRPLSEIIDTAGVEAMLVKEAWAIYRRRFDAHMARLKARLWSNQVGSKAA